MAYRREKNGEDYDIVIDGWEKGIAGSPHQGIANIKNGNISTESGEIVASFARQQQTMTQTSATGTLTYADSSHVNLSIPSTNNRFKGQWITVTASSNTGQLPNGTYYVSLTTGTTFQLQNYYNVSATGGGPAPTNVLSGFTAGLTATIQLVNPMGKPLFKATESYLRNGVSYNRYYILDGNNIVWVYDTYNDTIYSSSDNVGWFCPDYKTNWCTNAHSIAVLNGMLIAAAQSGLYAKPTVQLGGINTQNTTWAEFYNDSPWFGNSNANHFSYVGHQGYSYITDGSYIRSIFPDSTLSQKVSGVTATTTSSNVQSMGSWTANTSYNLQGYHVYNTPNQVAGPFPWPVEPGGFLPVILFTDGTLPTAITANQVYYLARFNKNTFGVISDPNMGFSGVQLATTATLSAGATSATLTTNWSHPTGYYLADFNCSGGTRTYNVLCTNGSASITWSTPLPANTLSTVLFFEALLDTETGAVGNQYYATFYPTASGADPKGNTPLYVLSEQRLTLPSFEVSQCLVEIGNQVLIGCKSNIVYPWDQVSNLPYSIISLPESNVQAMLTVNQVAYIFAGNQGNVYITDGSLASLILNVPDYVAGIPGSPGTYIESTYYWGDAMYNRGRVYFSLYDQSATKVGNAGGIWSFIPTQNFYLGQDIGIALRLESQNSYGTYNGYARLLLIRQVQDASQPLYWSAWQSDINTPTYGIDYSTNGTNASSPTIIETDAIPVGTLLNKDTFEQLEYKLGAPLDAGATITAKYRTNITDAWSNCGTFRVESEGISGYTQANFQKSQWLQFQFTLAPVTSSADTNTFIRFREIRLR